MLKFAVLLACFVAINAGVIVSPRVIYGTPQFAPSVRTVQLVPTIRTVPTVYGAPVVRSIPVAVPKTLVQGKEVRLLGTDSLGRTVDAVKKPLYYV